MKNRIYIRESGPMVQALYYIDAHTGFIHKDGSKNPGVLSRKGESPPYNTDFQSWPGYYKTKDDAACAINLFLHKEGW